MFASMLPTETVVLSKMVKLPPNKIGEVLTEAVSYTVEGCLVQPGSASELPEGMELLQRELVTVHVPTTFKEDLTDGEAIIRGKAYKILVAPLALTSSPLPWNRHVICDAVR